MKNIKRRQLGTQASKTFIILLEKDFKSKFATSAITRNVRLILFRTNILEIQLCIFSIIC